MKQRIYLILSNIAIFIIASCSNQTNTMKTDSEIQKKVDEFVEVELTSDISHLSESIKHAEALIPQLENKLEELDEQEALEELKKVALRDLKVRISV